MIQFYGIIGPIKNLVDGSKTMQISVDRKYKDEMHQIDDLFNNEVIVHIVTQPEAKNLVNQNIDGEDGVVVEEHRNYELSDEGKETRIAKLKELRQNIFLEIMNAGLELQKQDIYSSIVQKKQLRDCTQGELEKIWHFIIDGETLPITNYSNLRARLLKVLGEV